MNHNGLYNGNISWMVTDLAKIGEINNNRVKGMQAMMYKYDQLHRITKSRSLNTYSAINGFTKTTAAYDETYTYDGNGNILTLDRMNAQGQVLHDYDYYYYKNSNKLRGVLPIVRDTTYSAAINSNNKLYRDILVEGTARPTIGTLAELRATREITIQNNFEAEEGNDFAAYIPEDGPFVYDAIGNLIADQEEGSKISWTPYGKVRTVKTKNDSVVVKFRYDASGHRVEKIVARFDTTKVTRYIRDARGNVMSIYIDTLVTEQPIYSSNRIGTYKGNVLEGNQALGNRTYELQNQIDNVVSVITDNIGMDNDTAWSTIIRVSDYYPFGLDMHGRAWKDSLVSNPKYGFNAKERNEADEWGTTTYDYGFRIYNPEIAKFLSVDPLTREYPWYTPYQFAGNMPIVAIDLDGLEEFIIHHRSFAPWQKFGDMFGLFQKSFDGDWRGFSLADHTAYTPASTSNNASSRLYGFAKIKLGTPGFVDDFHGQTSSVTRGNYMFIGPESEDRAPERSNEEFDGQRLQMPIEGHDPLIWGIAAPDIDWNLDVKIRNLQGRVLKISGAVKGKNFPAYESFIEDSKGVKVFLTTVVAGESGDRLELPGELINPFYDFKEQIDILIGLDEDGNFRGNIIVNGKEYTIDAWNDMNFKKPAATDFEEGTK